MHEKRSCTNSFLSNSCLNALANSRALEERRSGSFAQALQTDRLQITGDAKLWAAVGAALTEEWSNGPVEGQVNWLKLIRRSMYGRAGFELLRARVRHAG